MKYLKPIQWLTAVSIVAFSQIPISSAQNYSPSHSFNLKDPSFLLKKFNKLKPHSSNYCPLPLPFQSPIPQLSGWKLVWHDEFRGRHINTDKWDFEYNCWGGGNNERQCFTDRPENAFVKRGKLNIVARKENFAGPALMDDMPGYDRGDTSAAREYTSASLRTRGKQAWKYGRIDIRAKMPSGQGSWSALWMMPEESVYGTWAASGEIDILETINLHAPSDDPEREGEPEDRLTGTIHYGQEWPNNVYTQGETRTPNGVNPADGYHVYSLEWEEGELRWYVDYHHYATQTSDNWYTQFYDEETNLVTGEGAAPFDELFHMILRQSVGGNYPENRNAGGVDENNYPQTLKVDYVRVYECSVDPETGKGCAAKDPNIEPLEGHQPVEPVLDFLENDEVVIFDDESHDRFGLNSFVTPGDIFNYGIIDAADTSHGKVIHVNTTTLQGSVLFYASPVRLNLSDWQDSGIIHFDIKVNDKSDEAALTLGMATQWPFVNLVPLTIPSDNEWHTVEVSISDLANSYNFFLNDPNNKMDIKNISQFIQFYTFGELDFELDNIRFVRPEN